MLNPTPFMATRSPKALRKSRQTSTGLSPPPDTELPLLHSVLAFNRPGIYIICTCSHERSWKHTRCTVRGGPPGGCTAHLLSLIHISEPTRRTPISYAVFCLKKKNRKRQNP